MPFKYIGRTHDFRGKSLWEILGNLKNLGVGRIVVRSQLERYPEPSYMKILKVETLPEPENPSMDNVRKTRVLVQKTFRGKKLSYLTLIESSSYKTDYRLLPKDEEATYCKEIPPPKSETTKILPRTMEFPPLLKRLIVKDCQSKGGPTKEDLELKIVYNKRSAEFKYRIAEEGEEPTEKISIKLGQPLSPNLYKGLPLE